MTMNPHGHESDRPYNPNDPMSIGREVRRRREAVSMPRAQLAGALSVDVRTLARWELEGTTEDNLQRVVETLERMRPMMSGTFPKAMTLDKISTVDLAVELLKRSRIMEVRDSKLLELKKNLNDSELGYLWPEGL
jgi:transcriptional regulator with XRE-family HTH domain